MIQRKQHIEFDSDTEHPRDGTVTVTLRAFRQPLRLPLSQVVGFCHHPEPLIEGPEAPSVLRRDPAIPAPPLRGQFTKPNFAIVFDPPAVLPKIRRFHGRSLGVTASERWARTANIDGLLLELLEPHSDTRTLGLLGVTEFPTLRSLLDTTIGSVPAAILTDATKRDRAKARRLALMSATLYFAAVMSSIPIRIAANADRWPTWATVSSMAAALSLLGAFWCQREHRRMRKRYRDGVDADAADSELRGGHLRRQ